MVYTLDVNDLFTSAAAFNFMLMYRFESSRSPTCKDPQHHFACLYERIGLLPYRNVCVGDRALA